MTTTAPMVSDELEAIVTALRQKYPEHPTQVEAVVAQVYADLAASAKVTAHLIPLTLNRSRRILAEHAVDGAVPPVAKGRDRGSGVGFSTRDEMLLKSGF